MEHFLTADLGFGDAGKGTVVDYLARRHQAETVVRYNGGAQAAHNVVTPEGRHHTFAQFGSGSFAGAGTHLSRFMVVNPLALVREGRALQELGERDIFSRLTVDEEALLTTPYHQAMNRLREIARGAGKHGSCGMGVGETRADFLAWGGEVPVAGDLLRRDELERKLAFVRELKRSQIAELQDRLPDSEQVRAELAVFDERALQEIVEAFLEIGRLICVVDAGYLGALLERGPVVFEGAQGVLLDESFGFHPYTTWTATTFENAETLLAEYGLAGAGRRIGILRGYMTRHGAGPFPTEDAELARLLPEQHNTTGTWQDNFRIGHMDLVAARYALDVVGGIDELALTSLDRLGPLPELKAAVSYGKDVPGLYENGRLVVGEKRQLDRQEQITRLLERCTPEYVEPGRGGYVEWVASSLGVSLGLVSRGPTALDKRETAPLAAAA